MDMARGMSDDKEMVLDDADIEIDEDENVDIDQDEAMQMVEEENVVISKEYEDDRRNA